MKRRLQLVAAFLGSAASCDLKSSSLTLGSFEATCTGSTKDKRASLGQPFSPRLDAGVDFYFLAFFAFFFFTIVSSFCSDIGKSEVCLEPINGPNPFNSKSRDLFHTMVNKIGVMSLPVHGLHQ